MSDKAEAMASLARQLEERVQDDALTPVTLSVEHAAELLESLRKPKPWERCSIHGPAEDRVWACPACLVELRTEVEALRADAERMRWIAAHCRSTAEHWGGRWSIVIDGPAPVRHDEEDALYAAIDAARSKT